MSDDTKIQVSSGNVWKDFGYEQPENMRLRARLAIAIDELIKARGWTQNEAAEHLGTDQGNISKIVNGEVSRFTVDRLVNLLAQAGQRVEVSVHGEAA